MWREIQEFYSFSAWLYERVYVWFIAQFKICLENTRGAVGIVIRHQMGHPLARSEYLVNSWSCSKF